MQRTGVCPVAWSQYDEPSAHMRPRIHIGQSGVVTMLLCWAYSHSSLAEMKTYLLLHPWFYGVQPLKVLQGPEPQGIKLPETNTTSPFSPSMLWCCLWSGEL